MGKHNKSYIYVRFKQTRKSIPTSKATNIMKTIMGDKWRSLDSDGLESRHQQTLIFSSNGIDFTTAADAMRIPVARI